MNTPRDRLSGLAERLPAWSQELGTLDTLLDVDVAASLNKMRTLTERMLYELCVAHDVSWGKGEATLERMVGPLLAAGRLPKQVGIHVRTVQSNASPGSHYQEEALDEQHLTVTLLAFVAVLDWYAPAPDPSARPAAVPHAAPPTAHPSDQRPWTRVALAGALAATVGLGVGVLVLSDRGAADVFTVDRTPVLYADAAKQRALEQAWEAAVKGQVRAAAFGLEPLLAEPQLPVEVVAFARTLTMHSDGTGLSMKVPDETKALPTGASLCARGWDRFDVALSETTEAAKRERFASVGSIATQMREWLEAHPEDLLTAMCLRPMTMGDGSQWAEAVERADPDSRSPWAIEWLVLEAARSDPEAALARVQRARTAAPGEVRLVSLEGEVRTRLGDYAEALRLFDDALERDPTDLDVRVYAARAAAHAGDEAALRRHLDLVMAREWPEDARAQALGDVLNLLILAGRPALALEHLGTLEHPAGLPAFYSGFMVDRLVYWPGLLTPEQRDQVVGMYRRGLGPEAHGGLVPTLDRYRTLAEVALEVTREDVAPPTDDARLGSDARALYAAGEGDPGPLIALLGPSDPSWRRDFQVAGAYQLAGQREQALEIYAALVEDQADDTDASLTARRAFAAGHLALAALERGAPEDAAPYVALYRELWPIAEDTMPLARSLAAHGVATGPRR